MNQSRNIILTAKINFTINQKITLSIGERFQVEKLVEVDKINKYALISSMNESINIQDKDFILKVRSLHNYFYMHCA